MEHTNPSREALEEAIRRAGSQTALARMLNKSQPHIHKWLNSKNPIRPEHCRSIELATGVARQWLRPKDYWTIWPDLAEPKLQVEQVTDV